MMDIGPDRLARVAGGWNRVMTENGSITVTGTVTTDGLNTITTGIMIGKTGISASTAGTMIVTKHDRH